MEWVFIKKGIYQNGLVVRHREGSLPRTITCTSAKDNNRNNFTYSKKQDKELHYLTTRKSKILQPSEDPSGT